MKTRKLDVYIVAKAYSGSTILGRDLNSHSKIFYTGELGRIPQYRKKYNYYEYDAGCMNCFIKGTNCKIFSENNLVKLGKKHPRLANEYLRRITKKPIIVDGSKYVDWLNINCEDQKYLESTRVIILVKSPIEYLYSCAVRGVGPIWQEANAWRDTYFDAIRTVNWLGLSSMVVKFDEYIRSPQTILKQICSYTGVDYQPSMLKSSNNPLHSIGGNPGAYEGIVGKRLLQQKAQNFDQKLFDINPNRVGSKLKKTKITKQQREDYMQILCDTPMLLDVANILGFGKKDIFN
jgi:hypothetical protein